MNPETNDVFHNIEEFEAVGEEIALVSNYVQMDHGLPTIRHDWISLEGMNFRRLQISNALFDLFAVREGWTTLVLTPAEGLDAVWNGAATLPDALGILHPGQDHEAVLPARWSTIEIDVADDLVEREGLLREHIFSDEMDPEKSQLRLSASAAANLRRGLDAFFDTDRLKRTAVMREDPSRALRRNVLDLLAASDAYRPSTKTRLRARRYQDYRLVRRARSLIDADLRGCLAMENLAADLGVSTRSLQRSFRYVLGVAPKQYFLARKLDAARRELRHRGQGTTVIDVAYDFGFVSPSRFAEQYRRQFGHTPSSATRFIGVSPLARSIEAVTAPGCG